MTVISSRHPADRTRAHLRRAVAGCLIALGALGAAACSSPSEERAVETALRSNQVDPVTLDQLADAIAEAGRPVTGRKDATTQLCPEAGCTLALTTDQFTLMKFPTTGRAELWAGENLDAFQLLDITMSFPANTPQEQQESYETALHTALS
ncbi:hypothetical protein [Gordonia sp. NB41Y]|uniref:hypothetical protein n=1 Tax=Gordonia sp. NB41Y TaxID=875808 RepID=UPI0006B1608A|nr:hypothetical protein [Gordonia sp. NB41Y]EMP12785.2 hypothetical protein ISGA_4909 [Gordonia sp. NB41Y]WLP92067.1 hypothetical protein Q9K23_07455 [Gordonia sp. NB41Y]